MEYFLEQITALKGYVMDSLGVLNDTGAIVLFIVAMVVMAIVAIPRIKK